MKNKQKIKNIEFKENPSVIEFRKKLAIALKGRSSAGETPGLVNKESSTLPVGRVEPNKQKQYKKVQKPSSSEQNLVPFKPNRSRKFRRGWFWKKRRNARRHRPNSKLRLWFRKLKHFSTALRMRILKRVRRILLKKSRYFLRKKIASLYTENRLRAAFVQPPQQQDKGQTRPVRENIKWLVSNRLRRYQAASRRNRRRSFSKYLCSSRLLARILDSRTCIPRRSFRSKSILLPFQIYERRSQYKREKIPRPFFFLHQNRQKVRTLAGGLSVKKMWRLSRLFVRKRKLSVERSYASLRYGLDWLLVRLGLAQSLTIARHFIQKGVLNLNGKRIKTVHHRFSPLDCVYISPQYRRLFRQYYLSKLSRSRIDNVSLLKPLVFVEINFTLMAFKYVRFSFAESLFSFPFSIKKSTAYGVGRFEFS